MKITVNPGPVGGLVNAPPSKSMTQRVYAAALLHSGRATVHNAGDSEDERAALSVIQQLGAIIISKTGDKIVIESSGVKPTTNEINCGESGLAARLFIPIAAMSDQEIGITGTGSLMNRPMNIYEAVLPQVGVTFKTSKGFLPVIVKGPFRPTDDIYVDGAESSQYVSGLMMALCYSQEDPMYDLKVKELASKPYVAMTMHVLELFGNMAGRSEEWDEFATCNYGIDIAPRAVDVTVEGDWSSAAFWLVAGAIAGEVTVSGLVDNIVQADSAIYTVLEDAGAQIVWSGGNVKVTKSSMRGFDFDATDSPDLFPILAILAACCRGESYIKGVHRLFHKESNRAQSISEMLENFNVPYSLEDDSLCITGVRALQGTIIDSCGDHRIAMAAAIGALRANGPVDILNAEAVSKSYPRFFDDLAQLQTQHPK